MSEDVVEQTSRDLLQDEQAVVQSASSVSAKTIRIQATLVAKLNLADFQNSVPVIRELRLINDTDEKYNGLELQLLSAPSSSRLRHGTSTRSVQALFYRSQALIYRSMDPYFLGFQKLKTQLSHSY